MKTSQVETVERSKKIHTHYTPRPGTNLTHGPDFEHQVITHLAIAACNQGYKDFWIASNVDGAGAFDDALLYTETQDGRKRLTLFQLKHKVDPSKKKLSIAEVNDEKYYNSFQEIQQLVSKPRDTFTDTDALLKSAAVPVTDMQFVFYTNSSVNILLLNNLKEISESFFFVTNLSAPVFQLRHDGTESQTNKDRFRSQFYILSEQIGVNGDELLVKIATELKILFNDNAAFGENFLAVAKELTDVTRAWFKEKSEIFTCNDVKENVSKLVLSKFIQRPIPGRQYLKLNERELGVWQTIMNPFQLVLFENEHSVLETFFDSNSSHRFIRCDDSCFEVVVSCLKLCASAKVILETRENSNCGAQIFYANSIKTFATVRNLSPILDELGQCTVTLQGRTTTFKALLEMYPEFVDIFNVDDVLKLLRNDLKIGEDFDELEFYVPRSVPRVIVKNSILLETSKAFFVLFVDDNVSGWELKFNNFRGFVSSSKSKVNFTVVLNNVADSEHRLSNVMREHANVHFLKAYEYMSAILLEWVGSSGSISEIRSHVDATNDIVAPIQQNEIYDNLLYQKKVVFVANPGMGKSFYLRQLRNEYPHKVWVMFVTLSGLDFNSSFEQYFNEYRVKMDAKSRQVFDVCFMHDSVVVLFDGFDEVAPEHETEALATIKEASGAGFKIVVSSRCAMKHGLETELDAVTRTLLPFTVADKEHFLNAFFSKRMQNLEIVDLLSKVVAFTRELMSKCELGGWDLLSGCDYDFTGVPLQCRLLAESYAGDCETFCLTGRLQLSENLNSLTLFETFVDKKFQLYWTEKESITTNPISFKRFLKLHESKFLQNHQDAAVQVIFPKVGTKISEEHFEELKNGEDKYGVITGIDGNSNPTFMHRTFAEYFAAKWLIDVKSRGTEEERTKYLKYLLRPEHCVVLDFFDRMVCRDCELHTAVLNRDRVAVSRILERGELDDSKCGRSALHLISARGAAHKWRRMWNEFEEAFYGIEWETDSETESELEADTAGETEAECEIVDEGGTAEEATFALQRAEEELYGDVLVALLSKGVCHVGSGQDRVLGWSVQQYAEHRKAFGIIDLLLKWSNATTRLFDWDRSFMHEWETDDLLRMCALHDYAAIAETLIQRQGLTVADVNRVECIYRSMHSDRVEGSLLHWATYNGSVSVMKVLLQYIDMNRTDGQKYTALHVASTRASLPAVQLLVSRDAADLLAPDQFRLSPLDLALKHDHKQVTEFFASYDVLKLAFGDDVNASIVGRTALHFASYAGNLMTVRRLINEGANVNATAGMGRTPLQYVCEGDGCSTDAEVVRLLVQAGANMDEPSERGGMALHSAVLNNGTEVVKELVRLGANTDNLNTQQQTALTVARSYWKEDAFLALCPHTSHITPEDERFYNDIVAAGDSRSKD